MHNMGAEYALRIYRTLRDAKDKNGYSINWGDWYGDLLGVLKRAMGKNPWWEKGDENLEKDHKIGSVVTVIGLSLLFGIGGLLIGGLLVGAAYMSDKKWKEQEDDLTDNETKEKVSKGNPPKEKTESIRIGINTRDKAGKIFS